VAYHFHLGFAADEDGVTLAGGVGFVVVFDAEGAAPYEQYLLAPRLYFGAEFLVVLQQKMGSGGAIGAERGVSESAILFLEVDELHRAGRDDANGLGGAGLLAVAGAGVENQVGRILEADHYGVARSGGH